MPRRKRTTAAEFVAELERDPAYQAQRARQEAELAERKAAIARDEQDLVAELRANGLPVTSVWDFVSRWPDPAIDTPLGAVPALLAHLERPHIPQVREGILRALAISSVRGAALEPLKRMFVASTDPSERWLIANAISTMAKVTEVRPELPGIEAYAGLFKRVTRRR